MIARKTSKFILPESDQVVRLDISHFAEKSSAINRLFHMEEKSSLKHFINMEDDPFLKHVQNLELDDKTLDRHGEILDIVTPESHTSCCFTKSYGRYAEGTGVHLKKIFSLEILLLVLHFLLSRISASTIW